MSSKTGTLQVLKNPDLQFSLALIGIVFVMFVPLPAFILDFFLSISIALGFLILLVSVYIKEPLDFSTFPTFLLLITLFRLALNIATTRSILLNGGKGNVSRVVSAFGNFVVGSNYFVGFVIFLILVLINFIVITKGASRVAEVGARFTLDAMPGKQMAIDADLNAGIIDREEAKKRRAKIEREADFYGAMDGASKFVRGDAIAGIVITSINIVVGLLLGVFQHNMTFARSAQVYALLTVGDGLVSQIPSIVISVAAGIVVTRASHDAGLSSHLKDQIFIQPKALYVCGGLLLAMAFIPGLPGFSFLFLSAFFFFLGKSAGHEIQKKSRQDLLVREKQIEKDNPKEGKLEQWLQVDMLSLEVGVGLIPLVDKSQNGEILERIVATRKQFAQDLGMIVPMVMVRDNIQLRPGEYQILLKGDVMAKGSLLVDHDLAMAPEEISLGGALEGIPTKEPAYGLDAIWIRSNQKDEALFKGYTVVNGATVVVTHISKIIHEYAHELLGRQEVQNLIETLREQAPKLVEEVVAPDLLSLGHVVQVLKNLLREQVSIKDLNSIFEALADHARNVKSPSLLTRYVRRAMARSLIKKYTNAQEVLLAVTLDRALEDLMLAGFQEEGGLSLDPVFAQKIMDNLARSLTIFQEYGATPLILCGGALRAEFKLLVDRFIAGVVVLSFEEIPNGIKIKNLGMVKAQA